MTQSTPNPAMAYEKNLVPAMFRPWSEELLKRAKPRPGHRVLDVACGTGIMVRQVAPQIGPEGSVVGLDISEPMLEVAMSLTVPNGAAITWQQGDAENLPFPDASFDLVLCQQGLQFVPSKPAATGEMRRVLDSGGRAVVSVWRDLDHHPAFAAIDEAINKHLGASAAGPFSLGDSRILESHFDNAGFEDATIDTVTRDVTFPSAEGFVRIIVMSAAAVIPELGEMDEEGSDALIDAVGADVSPKLEPYRDGEGLTFPMHAHIVVASA